MADEEGPEKKEDFLEGYPTVDDYSSRCMKTIAKATASSGGIPADKKQDWDYYTTFKSFRQVMGAEQSKIQTLMNKVLAWNGIKGRTPDNVEDMMDFLTEANDQLLERINTRLDEASGLKKDVDPMLMSVTENGAAVQVSGSWNKRKSLGGSGSDTAASPMKLLTAKNVSRPQLKFKDLIDNSSKPFIPRLKEKPNSKKPLSILPEYTEDNQEFYSHPYLYELDMLRFSREHLAKGDPGALVSLDEAEFECVETPESLGKMVQELKKEKVIAVDTEHHSYRTYLGLISLIQISTRTKDYVIDPYPLWRELTLLNEVFTDPKIVKVLHGSDGDLKWLQRDFSVYIVNLFDTHLAAKRLDFPPGCRSFAFLLKHYCQLTTDKQFQLADWRIRPLSQDLLRYARTDTRYLIHIYHTMKNALIEAGNENNNLLTATLEMGTALCKTRYNKPEVTNQSHMELLRRCRMHFNSRQLYALKELYSWRDGVAREEDESDSYVIPVHMLLKICTELPREMQGILACCNPIPPLVKQNLHQMHLIILKAREQPVTLLRDDSEDNAASKEELAALHSNVVEDPLKSPLDLGEHSLTLGGPVFLGGKGRLDPVRKVPIKDKPALSVFDSARSNRAERRGNNTKVGEAPQKVAAGFLSPYQRYQMLKPYLQFLNKKDSDKDDSSVSDIDRVKSIQEHFEALTAMTAEEYTADDKKKDVAMAEEDSSEPKKGDEESAAGNAAMDAGPVKQLRTGGKKAHKRKSGKGGVAEMQPPKVAKEESNGDSVAATSSRLEPKDYENADLSQFSSEGNNKRDKRAAGGVPAGQFNPWEGMENKKKSGGPGRKQKQRYRAGNQSISYKK